MAKTYTTVQGDMWDSIAYKQLGDVFYTDELMRLNMNYHDTFIFPAGVELILPEISTPVADNLPPWKRVSR